MSALPRAPLVVADDLLGLVGGTPLVDLGRALPSTGAAGALVLGKCEHWNPGGSVKDRIALAMLEAAEAAGTIAAGETVIVEPTSGNTGIGLAIACAVKGYQLVLTMPASMSLERRALLRAYGAELVLTDATEGMAGAVARARALCASLPRSFMPQQFDNPENPAIHKATTGPEIIAQVEALGRRVDVFVSGVGTGGTITGVGRALRERWPGVRLVAVEPAGSPVLSGGAAGPHKIQGIGAGFIPAVLDRTLIDRVVQVTDREAYDSKVRLARQAGLLVGISAGAAFCVAGEEARHLPPEATVVTILCDTGERYFSLDEYFA